MTHFRYPRIDGSSQAEQLAQIRSYLHQLVDQLNWLLSAAGTEQEETWHKP